MIAPVSEEKLIVTDDLPESLKDEKPPVEDEKTETPRKNKKNEGP